MADLVVDYDPAIWVLLDPGDDDVEDWAVSAAQHCLEDTGSAPEAMDVTRLSTVLLAAWEGAADLPGFGLLHLPNPYADAGPLARLTAVDPGDGSPESLRELSGADDEDLVEPAVVDWFETPIGGALRCRRYMSERMAGPRFLRRAPQTSMAVSYVWHLRSLDADVRLSCVSSDIGQLTAVLDDVDALARSIRVVAEDQVDGT